MSEASVAGGEGACDALGRAAAFIDRLVARRLGALYASLVALTLAPILVWPIPRTWDLVNHWARLTLYGMGAGDPLAAVYDVRLALLPNLAIDLVDRALSPFLSAQAVIDLAWVASIALPAWGAWRVARALDARPQPLLLLVPLVSYNLVVTVGLINFALGLALALHAFASWIAIPRARLALRLALFNLVAVALFFCHLGALAAFALIVGAYEVAPQVGEAPRAWARRLALGAAGFAAALPLVAMIEPIDAKFEAPGTKAAALAAPFFTGAGGLAVQETLALLGLAAFAALTGRLRLALRMRFVLAALAAAILLLPSSKGAAYFIDARLVPLLAALAAAAVRWPAEAKPVRIFALIAAALTVARVAAAAPDWARYDREVAEFRAAIRVVPAGARAVVVEPPEGACADMEQFNFLQHVANFLVIDRRASVNTLFTGKGMQPVRLKDQRLETMPWVAYQPKWLFAGTGPAASWRSYYDTLIELHGDCAWRLNAPGLKEIAATPAARVFRVE